MSVRRHVTLLVATIVVILGTFTWTLLSDNRPVLGLDLQGGISIVLFPVEGTDTSGLDTAVDIIRNRVDGLGIAEPEVQRQGDTIVVDLPGVEDREQAEQVVGQTAELRFRLVQNILPWATPVPTTTIPTTTTVPGATTTTIAGATTTVPTTTAPTTTTTAAAAPTTTVPGATTTTTTPPLVPEPGQTCEDLITPRAQNTPEATVWLPGRDDDGDGSPDACYLLGPTLLTGRNIDSAEGLYDPNTGSYAVSVEFTTDEFATAVAQPNVGQNVAIELDGVVQSAPTIGQNITGRDVQITGEFSKGDANDLALVLRYGALPVQFDPDEQTVQSISPTLGRDQLHAGIVAGIIGIALVAIYMILYYRLLGLVVVIGLGLTGLMFFTIVSWLSATRGQTLTLAGVTGLIVSVGVTVDSYVVYFERLKDEIRTGKTLRSSLESGFHRAFRTIIAADLVSLLGAAVLFLLATGSVRGFALFLGISTAIDLVLAYCYMHPLVSLMARRPSLVRMPAVGIASGLDAPELRA